jgi:hypothetical protein
MTRLEIVESLIGQISALGLEIELVVIDTGSYSVEVINYLSRFNFIIAVPVEKVGIYRSFDGERTLKSNGKKTTFRLMVQPR